MKKVTIIGHKTVMDKAIGELHRLKAVHITDHKKSEFDIGSPFERAEKLSELLVSVRAISLALGISGKKELSNGFRAVGVKNIAGLGKAVNQLKADVSMVQSAAKESEEELKKLGLQEMQLSCLSRLGLSLGSISGCRSIAYFVGAVKDVDKLRKSLLAVTDRFELISVEDKSGFLLALFIDSGKKAEASELLSNNSFSELSLAEVNGMKGSVSAALESVAKTNERLRKRIAASSRELAKLGKVWNDFLLLSEQLLARELEKAEAPLRFGVSKSIFVMQGWVPARELESLETTLGRATGEKIFVESELPHHRELVPVKLDNPKPVKPFEFFMSLYALPKYNEIDPTLFMFLTFPLFFGFILGDVGYGLVSFFLLLWLKEKLPGASKLVNVIVPAAVSSVVFGFLYGEVFGFEQAFGIEFPRIVSRSHDISEMLFASVVIGLVHINLGFVLGFFNELRHKGLFKAFAAKLSWILLEAGIAIAATSKISGIPVAFGTVTAIAALVLIYIGESRKPLDFEASIRSLIEVPGLFSNLLSYTRLMAVGLSSVSLAAVFNSIAMQSAHGGALGMFIAVLILFIGHTINLALGLLGGFLHSLRLHYVEFFTKFFEGGAVQFKPFGAR